MTRVFARVLTVAALGAFATAAACSDDASTGNGNQQLQDSGTTAWSAGACGTCVTAACTAARADCGADPGCAAWLSCFEACPESDAACGVACATPSGSAGEVARARFNECRLQGAGSGCTACGTSDGGIALDPLLTQQCPASAETNECWKCEDEHCCDSYAACKVDSPECSAFSLCINDCTTTGDLDTCFAQCDTQNPGGIDLYLRRLSCVQHRCLKECGESEDPCLICANTECGNESVACDTDQSCYKLQRCIAACPQADGTCINACISANPTPHWEPYQTCITQRCTTSCG